MTYLRVLETPGGTWMGSVQETVATRSKKLVTVMEISQPDLEDRKIQKDFADCDGYG